MNDEHTELFERLSHDEKESHIRSVNHISRKYGDEYGTRFEVEMRLLTCDQEIASLLERDPPPLYNSEPAGVRLVTLEEVQAKGYLFLGEVVEWIASRGAQISASEFADRQTDVERDLFKLFDRLDREDSRVPIEGYPAPNSPRVYEALPLGIWSKMNSGSYNDPIYSRLDDSEQSESGGSISVGQRRWDGVRLDANFVLEHWPPLRSTKQPTPPERASTRRSASPANLKRAVEMIIECTVKNRFSSPTKDEVADLLQTIFKSGTQPIPRKVIREAVKPIELKWGIRRGQRKSLQKNNRNNEIAAIRQFLLAADWRK